MTAAAEVSTCLVCGSGRSRGAYEAALRQCLDCTFSWTAAEIATPEELYDDAYFNGAGYEDYFVPSARRYEAGLRLQWLLAGGTPATLVEAGCAAGFFVEAAEGNGIAARGVEVCAAAVRFARDDLGVKVTRGCFESAVFGTAFDAVCAFHVLEHVEDPQEFLDAAWRAVEPGGRLALEVPNIASGAARRLGTSWRGLQPEYHRWHFTPASLARLVTDHGFEIIQQDTAVFRFYMPPAYRRRAGRGEFPADVRNLRSVRLTHPSRGDLLRLIARRPTAGERTAS
jgi:2-polyprenyl-3-methyl-5-hydroxy-6-metoxy-1,4-benzoquinol methylase